MHFGWNHNSRIFKIQLAIKTFDSWTDFQLNVQKLGSSMIESGKCSLESNSDINHFSFETFARRMQVKRKSSFFMYGIISELCNVRVSGQSK